SGVASTPYRPSRMRARPRGPATLVAGPRAAGYATELWTCPRVAEVMRHTCGVHDHPAHGWRVLRALRWRPQKPEHRARERDEKAIQHWRTRTWPRLKKARQRKAHLVFLDESGLRLQPTRRRTWAPRGQ